MRVRGLGVLSSCGALALAACAGESEGGRGNTTIAISGTDGPGGLNPDDQNDDDNAPAKLDIGGGDGEGNGCGGSDLGCTDKIDLLFVIDNSGTMAVEQANLARNFPLLIQKLENLTDASGRRVEPDVQIMVTNTDFGNPQCRVDPESGYMPSKGAPVTTACTERLGDFTAVGSGGESLPEVCTNSCVSPVAPEGDPFVAFSGDVDNIPDGVTAVDINGDGEPDSPVAQALACVGPQGINGCGFESPLENMAQALNPDAEWNTGERPFLRPDALLAVAIITDEADCSVMDWGMMSDPAYQETPPTDRDSPVTSAVCWNAGVTCTGPDAAGVYGECTSSSIPNTLQPISRYTNFLVQNLREQQGKEVVMLGILGVPEVTAHSATPPFEPTAGGVFDLEYRDWREGEFPAGDILPDEAAAGADAVRKQYEFGIGPGCTGGDAASGFTGQAVPPVRLREVCEALNIENSDGSVDVRCCMESICDDDFSAAIECLTGIIGEAIEVPG